MGFLESNIKSGFERCGIWPVNPKKLLNTPPPQSSAQAENISSSEELLGDINYRSYSTVGIGKRMQRSGNRAAWGSFISKSQTNACQSVPTMECRNRTVGSEMQQA